MNDFKIDINDLVHKLSSLPKYHKLLMMGFTPKKPTRELNKTQEKTLFFIHILKECSMTEIGKHVGLEKGAFSILISKLISLDYVTRKRCEKDRRIVYIHLTEKGEQTVQKIENNILEHIHKKLEKLTVEEQIILLNSLRDLETIMEKIK